MADKLYLELVSPEKLVVSSEVDDVLAQGVEGEFGILPGHAPFVTALTAGGLMYRIGDELHGVIISKGFLKVVDNKVIVLAENPEHHTEIDLNDAREQKEIAEKCLADCKDADSEEAFEAKFAVSYHQARLDFVERVRK